MVISTGNFELLPSTINDASRSPMYIFSSPALPEIKSNDIVCQWLQTLFEVMVYFV